MNKNQEKKFENDTRVYHKDFGFGVVDHQNMSGPVIKFKNYEHEMCVPLWDGRLKELNELDSIEMDKYDDPPSLDEINARIEGGVRGGSMNEEIWKDIPGYEGYYQASDHGRIRGVTRYVYAGNQSKRLQKGRILKQYINGLGYLCVCLAKDGHRKTTPVHPLVMYSFKEKVHGLEIDHIDLDKTNNKLSNLRLTTKSDNQRNRNAVGGSSNHKGVSYFKNTGRWRAQIKTGGKSIHIGYFNTEEEAAKAYDRKAGECFGDYARYNFM